MWFGYHPNIIERFPEIASAVIWVKSFDNVESHEAVEAFLAASEQQVRTRCVERADISRQPTIAAWRDVYSRMGLKPNRYPCATEQLMRRVVDGNPAPRINALVDLCNAAALQNMITVAPFDLERVEEYCQVRYATGNERFWPINADEPDEIPAGEVIFADDSPDVISRRWAWRQSDKGKITETSSQVVVVAEAVDADAIRVAEETGMILIDALRSSLGAEATLDVLHRSNPVSNRPF